MRYIKYLKYIIRHKWYVMLECFRVGLIWRGLAHDFSKLFPDEFIHYANHFYGNGHDISYGRDETGYYKPTDTGDKEFDFAWLLHQKRNRHHWQWWILAEEGEGVKILEIKYPYNLEMICDWVGAGEAQGKFPPKDDRYFYTRKWYETNKDKMQLHPNTREFIEKTIEIGKENA